MNSPRTISLLLLALLVGCFSLAAKLSPQFQAWRGSRMTGDVFAVVLGDGRLGILCAWALATVLRDVTLVGHHPAKLLIGDSQGHRARRTAA